MKKTGRYTIHPRSISITLLQYNSVYCYGPKINTGSSNESIFVPQVVKGHQINILGKEFAGRIRNKKLINFYPCDNSLPVGGKY